MTAYSSLVISHTKLGSFDRLIVVRFASEGRAAVDLVRESIDGEPKGSIRIHAQAFETTRKAVAAARAGATGIVGTVYGWRFGVRFEVMGAGVLAISIRHLDGTPRGGTTVLRNREIDHLSEALDCAAITTT